MRDDAAPSWLVASALALLRAEPIREALAEVLAGAMPARQPTPALLTPDQLAQQLQVSRSKLDSMLTDDPTFPFVRVGAVRRFELEKVLDHLREQSDDAA